MSKKSIIICICVALVLLAGIGVAVAFLYSGVPTGYDSDEPVRTDVIKAIPSDAAAVITFKDLHRAVSFLSDAKECFSPVFRKVSGREFNALLDSLSISTPSSLRNSPVCISLHYSGSFIPLMAVEDNSEKQLESLRDAAETFSLYTSIQNKADKSYLIISPSQTCVESSIRHLGGRNSIKDNESFAALYSRNESDNVIYVSHAYAQKLIPKVSGAPLAAYSDFIGRSALWTSFAVVSAGGGKIELRTDSETGGKASCYHNVLKSMIPGTSKLREILPDAATFAVGLCSDDFSTYREAYAAYMDASMKPVPSTDDASVIKEVAAIRWNSESGNEYEAVCVRYPSKQAVTGFDATRYGKIFDCEGSRCQIQGDWAIYGTTEALDDWKTSGKGGIPLPSKDCGVTIYIPGFSAVCSRGIFRISTIGIETASAEVVRETMNISRGPFKVKNCSTGKINEFYQNSNLYLCLRDESGKGLWGVMFDTPICGCVETVDYYANGKLQFLFAAGSKLYLIDRLGSFVTGFPVQLASEVLLGPAVYEFAGDRKYNVMVLNKDNTIEMYDLRGKKPDNWKGIAPDSPVLALPQLKTLDGKMYWIVRTTSRTLAYEFWGGDPLTGKISKALVQ